MKPTRILSFSQRQELFSGSSCVKYVVYDDRNNNRYDWVARVIYWELCKSLKFCHAAKWYIHWPESVLENETYKILRDFEIQKDHPIPSSKLDLVLISKKKKSLSSSGICCSIGPQNENERKWKDWQILES